MTYQRAASLWSHKWHWRLPDSDRARCGLQVFDTSIYPLEGECGNCRRLLDADDTPSGPLPVTGQRTDSLPAMTEPVEPETTEVYEPVDPLALSVWSRITIAVVIVTMLGIIASIVIYSFRSQSFHHDEKLREQCAGQGGDWRGGDCHFYNPFDQPDSIQHG